MTTRRLPAVAIALALASGCAANPLFTVDSSLQFTAPRELSTVTAPVRVAWRTRDLPSGAQQYAVFVDRRPLAPGQNLRVLADDTCKNTRGCPDAGYLRDLGIFLSTEPEVMLDSLPVLGGMVARDRPVVHQVTVVLINAEGDRVGEYSYDLQFRLAEPERGTG